MMLWNRSKGELSAYLSRGGYTITTVLFLNRRGLILTVDMGGGITLWGQKERHAVLRFNAHDARIWSVATSHDEKWLVTAGADGRIVTWDLATLRILQEHRSGTLPTACAIDTHSGHVVVGDRNGDFLVLDGPHISAGTEVAAMPLGDLFEQNRMVAFVTKSLDGDYGRFSTRLLRALDKTSLVYVTVDVTELPLYRQTLARISGCPLFPQLYVHERFVGGSEVAVEMVEAGVLHRLFSSPAGG